MSDEQPCPGCGLGSFVFGSRSLGTHFSRHCTKILLKPPPATGGADLISNNPQKSIAKNNKQSPTDKTNPIIYKFQVNELGNPIVRRNFLEARVGLSSQVNTDTIEPFIFENNNEERWELNNNPPPIILPIIDLNAPNQNTPHKSPFQKNVPLTNGSFSFQIDLMDLLQRHKADLKLHDEIINLMDSYFRSGKLDSNDMNLLSRQRFIKKVEESFKTTGLKPIHENVTLSDGSKATISLFDIEYMILSLLTDESLMQDKNIAEGYNLFTGSAYDNNQHNNHYGEIHTGDAWKPALNRFCGNEGTVMPIALIVFGDKTYTDLHGSLSVTPIIFTLTLFNSSARNNPSFWRPLAYIPNLSHGKAKSDKTQSKVKVQDEHTCLALVFRSLRELHKSRRGMKMKVKGKFVTGIVWIHFFIGDTAGNNTWLAHYNGSGKLKRPYRDCQCNFGKMSHPDPKCTYITLNEMRETKRQKIDATTNQEKDEIFQVISKHDERCW